MKSLKVALAALAAGALAGVLFAPAKGSVTRRRITQHANTYADEIRNSFEELSETVSQTLDAVKGEVSTFRKTLLH